MARLKKTATDEEKRTRFLEELARCGNVTEAAKQANIARRTAYNWRNESPAFAAEWATAADLGTDALEDEAIRRAHAGVLEPVYQGRMKVGTIRRFSDTLLIFLLKGRRPERYRDAIAHRHGGDPENKTPIPHEHGPTTNRIEQYLAAIEGAADREEASDPAIHLNGKHLDSGHHQNGTNGKAS